MRFNRHSDVEGLHAILSPSNYHWINYTEEKLDERLDTLALARQGTRMHEFAHQAISLGVKLPRTQKTINLYVNDCIGWRMQTETVLFYSHNVFGTADAISFRLNVLRISDLKTGSTPTSVHQLEAYAALFCLEYNIKPFDIQIELRIYQNDDVVLFDTDYDAIVHIMDKIVCFDKQIQARRREAEL